MVRILKDLKEKHPEKDIDQLIEMANYSALVHQKKSRAFYRVQATRMMIGAGNILKKHVAEHSRHTGQEDDLATCSHISFESAHYQCTENCGSLSLGVILEGGTGQNTFYVDFCTENGSANAGADYEFSEGTLVFKPGEIHKEIKVRKEKIMQSTTVLFAEACVCYCGCSHYSMANQCVMVDDKCITTGVPEVTTSLCSYCD